MGVNLNRFFKELDREQDKILDEVERIIKDVVSSIFISLQPNTPLQTGWLRSNWLISINTPRVSPIGSKKNISPALSAQKASFTKFLSQSLNNVEIIFLNNNVPYGEFVNNGTSTRPPTNFVQKSVLIGLSTLNKNRVIK